MNDVPRLRLVTAHGGLVDVDHALDELAAGRGARTVLAPSEDSR